MRDQGIKRGLGGEGGTRRVIMGVPAIQVENPGDGWSLTQDTDSQPGRDGGYRACLDVADRATGSRQGTQDVCNVLKTLVAVLVLALVPRLISRGGSMG